MRRRFLMRSAGLAAVVASGLAVAGTADAARYVVLFKGKAVPASAESSIAAAGGTLVYSYDRIGVAIADSDDPAFLDKLDGRRGVASAADVGDEDELDEPDVDNPREPRMGRLPNLPATDADTFSPLQWDMRQIGTDVAHATTGGSPAVLVGHLDSGVDYTHPDLVPNLDLEDSVSCVGGVPNQGVDPVTGRRSFDDAIGHGTHTAGTIVADDNGSGTVGVAPNVRLAAVKVVDPAGKIYPEAVICGFMWAATHGFDVTNNSYSIDKRVLDPSRPTRNGFYCRDNPAERVALTAVRRALRFATKRGVSTVASTGNNNTDLASSPAGDECKRLPVQLPGVIGVSSDSPLRNLTFNSNYGLGVVDLTAPGGDPFDPGPPGDANQVLSTFPTRFVSPATPGVRFDGGGAYRRMIGTSSAAPHVTGVAALVISAFGDDSPGNGRMKPKHVRALLQETAREIACPPNPYVRPVPPLGTFTANCFGEPGFNGFYGHGEVNALAATE